MSVYGNLQKIRNFEKKGTKWGQNVIHGDFLENGSARNGNVSTLYGRTTWAFKFKLTPALLALRVCKPGGGRRVVSYLGAKEISWTKNFSGGLEVSKQTGGLVEAQPVVQVPSLKKGNLRRAVWSSPVFYK